MRQLDKIRLLNSVPEALRHFPPEKLAIIEKQLGMNKEELYGSTAISYQRFSTPDQRFGTSLDRQDDDEEETTKEYKLVLTEKWKFREKGRSGGGSHRKKGAELYQLCRHLGFDAVTLMPIIINGKPKQSEIEPGTVLIIETFTRLDREKFTDAWKLIETLTSYGIIIIFGNMRFIPWNHGALSGPYSQFLHNEIYRSHGDSKEKANRTKRGQQVVRDRVQAIQEAQRAGKPFDHLPLPWVGTPAWMERSGTKDRPVYTLHDGKGPNKDKPNDKATGNAIFKLLVRHDGVFNVVSDLANEQKLPLFGRAWRGK